MSRVTWISAVQEYNKRNNTKVKGKKGSPEYQAIKELFDKLKRGEEKKTVITSTREPVKIVKLTKGETVEVKCTDEQKKPVEVKEITAEEKKAYEEREKPEEPKKEKKKREEKETKEQKRAREVEELKKKYIEEQRRATIRGAERGEQERAERTKLRGPSWEVIRSLFLGGQLDEIKKRYDEGKFTLKNIQDFIQDEKNADKDKISKLQRLIKECSYNEIEEFRRCVSDLKDKLAKRTNSAETINNILESFKNDFLTNDYDRFNVWCKSLRYLRERKCNNEIKKVKDLMLYVKNNEMKAGKNKFKMINMKPVNEILDAIEGKAPEPEETKEDILNIFERKGLVEELTEDDPDVMEYAELEAEEKAPPPKCKEGDPKCEKKRDIKSKLEELRKCLADEVKDEDISFKGLQTKPFIVSKFKKLAEKLAPANNKDCLEEADRKAKLLVQRRREHEKKMALTL